jgi:hypothetical protein
MCGRDRVTFMMGGCMDSRNYYAAKAAGFPESQWYPNSVNYSYNVEERKARRKYLGSTRTRKSKVKTKEV